MINHFKAAKDIQLKGIFTDKLFSPFHNKEYEEIFKQAI